jgi:SAM-dependent methyltransferase
MRLKSGEVAFWKRTALEDLDYHSRQFQNEYRSTVHLTRFLKSLEGLSGGEALDVGCGAGANIYHIARQIPGFRWTGIDVAGSVVFPIGRRKLDEAGIAATLVEGDFNALTEIFPGRRFDLVLSIQTLLVLPHYEKALDELLAMTGDWLIVTSLFTDFHVDARVEVWDWTWSPDCQGPYYYSVFSVARFREFCTSRGFREVASRDFAIDIDLPRPAGGGLKTFTESLADGRRLQFTGPIFQPWKFLAFRRTG